MKLENENTRELWARHNNMNAQKDFTKIGWKCSVEIDNLFKG